MLNRLKLDLFANVANAQRLHLTLQRVSDFTGNIVELNYTCYETNSSKSTVSPVVVLHGLLSSKNSWKLMSEAIHRTTGRKVINVDARNHGDSPHYPQNTYIDMANDTVNLIKKLELPKVTLLGQSMGGRTAMVMSLLYPELVSSVVVVDVSPVTKPRRLINYFPRVFDAMHGIQFNGIVTDDEALRFARKQLRVSEITHKNTVDLILKNVGIKPDKTIGWIPNVGVLREDFPTLLRFPYIPEKVFPGPALFIKAGKSDFLPLEDLPGIERYYPQVQLKCIPGVGHNIQDEDPSTLLQFITEFLMKYNF